MYLFQVHNEVPKQSKGIAFIEASGRAMPDGFKECNIRYNGRQMGIIVFMSDSPESRMDLLTQKQDPGFGFFGNEARFNRNGKIAMQVAAAFHSLDGQIEGALVERGVIQNLDISEKSGSALVIIDGNGKPAIRNTREFLLHTVKRVDFFNEAEKKKWSVFQQLFIIENGKPAETGKVKSNDFSFFRLRFLVEMQNRDGSSSYGIISFEENVSLNDAIKIMMDIKQGPGGKGKELASIKNAVYLDSGSVGKGFVYYKNGIKRLTGKGDFDDKEFSNMIVLYSQPDKNSKFFAPVKH